MPSTFSFEEAADDTNKFSFEEAGNQTEASPSLLSRITKPIGSAFKTTWELLNTPEIMMSGPAKTTVLGHEFTDEDVAKEVKRIETSGTPVEKRALGVREGIDDFLSSLTTPLSLGTLGVAGVLSKAPAFSRALSAAFVAQTGKSLAVDTAQALGEEYAKPPDERDPQKLSRLWVSAAVSAPFTSTLGSHAILGERSPLLTQRTPLEREVQNASDITSPTRVPEPEVRARMGEEAPLRQPGETAGTQERIDTGARQAAQAPQEVQVALPENIAQLRDALQALQDSGKSTPEQDVILAQLKATETVNKAKQKAIADELKAQLQTNALKEAPVVEQPVKSAGEQIAPSPAEAEKPAAISEFVKWEVIQGPEGEWFVTNGKKTLRSTEGQAMAKKTAAALNRKRVAVATTGQMYESPPPPKEVVQPIVKPTPEASVVPKEPWQMTQEEHVLNQYRNFKKIQTDLMASDPEGKYGSITQRKKIIRQYNELIKSKELGYAEKQVHRGLVEKAIEQGKPVPPEVLADYPDLQNKGAGVTQPPTQSPVSPAGESITQRVATEQQKSQAEPTVESVTPLEVQSGSPKLTGLGGALAEGEPAKAELAQLTDATRTLAEQSRCSENLGKAFDFGKALDRTKESLNEGLSGLKSAYEYAKTKFIGAPVWTNFKAMLGDRHLSLSESANNARKWSKLAQKAVPNEKTQEAISNFIDTGGNDAVLERAATETKPRYRAGYEQARNLTPEQKTLAANVKNYFDARLQDAVDAGILTDGIEDYIHRIYESDSPWKQGVLAELRSGIFTGKPALAKQRVYQYDFEAEKAGLRPIKSFIKRVAAYDLSLNKAMADRKAVKDMMAIKMSDGRPMIDVGGLGKKIEGDEGVTEATLIKPSYKPQDEANPQNHRGDYKPYDHPALRKWKWATNDENGKPIFVQGEVLVHPDAIQQVERLFNRSKVRQNPVGRLALSASSTVKQTMLDLSGFHPTQITVHGWEHRTFKPVKEIDFTDPDTRGLIRGGMVVGETTGRELFSEGLTGSSLTRHIPGLGPKLQAYNEWLFNSYIPRLKVATGLHALERNRSRFPELSEDKLYHLTANEMNGAFGELNYEMLGRSKTMQDVMRLALLAPDFLEARGRFVAQAGTKYGREQFTALALGAATLYVTARIMNKLLDNEYHMEMKNAFSIVHNGRAYSLRTVQGDLLHLISEPGRFLYTRLNPTYGRTGLELLTGRDAFGRSRSGLEQLRDLGQTIVPISLRGLLNPSEQKLWESMLNSIGITERRSTPTDTIFELAKSYKKQHGISEPGEFIYDREKDPYRAVKLALAYETPEKAAQEMAIAIRDGKTDWEHLSNYFKRYGTLPFTGSKKNDALFYQSLTADEKKIFNDAVKQRQTMRTNGIAALQKYQSYLAKQKSQPALATPASVNPFTQ